MESLSQVPNSQTLLTGRNEAGTLFGNQSLHTNHEGGLCDSTPRPIDLARANVSQPPLQPEVLLNASGGLNLQDPLGRIAGYDTSQLVRGAKDLLIQFGAVGLMKPPPIHSVTCQEM
ncbi:hypothetical protein R1flu_003254 [Riccia fluitans]|uniref:Uncharacterized protein n=1 Tax=Riccia fluitans TaxID=41844 RepID=A0ABD1Y9E6_9MARC